MNILSFNKLTKPIYEGGATIDLRPKGMWQISVRRTDGTYRYPFGEHWLPNLFINRFADGLLGGVPTLSNQGNGFNWSYNTSYSGGDNTAKFSFISGYFFGLGQGRKLAVGSSSAAVSATQTALQAEVRADSTPSGGNSASINFTTGGITYTIDEIFPAETGTVSYNEAAIKQTTPSTSTSGMINGLTSAGILNRIVFPGTVTLVAGEALALKIAVTIQSAAGTNGIPINIAAQNGVNISGDLKLIGTEASILGGTVTPNGVTTLDTTYPLLFNLNGYPSALLSDKTAFDTQNTNPNWGTTNPATGGLSAYVNGTRYRDATFIWGSGTPATNTNFRSILMRSLAAASAAKGGYHLLLDNEMTKETTATLALSLRFSV